MIAVCVRAEYPCEAPSRELGERSNVLGDLRPGVDDHQCFLADDVAVGAGPRHHAGIGRRQPAQAGRERRYDACDYSFHAPDAPVMS